MNNLFLEFQSTLPARGATAHNFFQSSIQGISIHAPRTGSDTNNYTAVALHLISIHAPRTGSDWMDNDYDQHPEHFNPRSPHGERQWDDINKAYSEYISIHAPRTGSDGFRPCAY